MRKIVSSLLLIWIYQSLCGAHRSIGRWEGSSCIADLAPPPRLKLRRRREKITSSPAVAHWGICRSDPLLGGLTGAVTCWNAPEAVASTSSFILNLWLLPVFISTSLIQWNWASNQNFSDSLFVCHSLWWLIWYTALFIQRELNDPPSWAVDVGQDLSKSFLKRLLQSDELSLAAYLWCSRE